ncbi:MAG TPA: hypothetical protein VFQ74_10345 [Pseudolysinimonas sp.]|nr:hypothetical protein [Pseudolysinimonas sp.]
MTRSQTMSSTSRDHIIRGAWRTRNAWRGHVADAAAAHPDLRVIRLRSRTEVESWVSSL